jgi:hypothetical protein
MSARCGDDLPGVVEGNGGSFAIQRQVPGFYRRPVRVEGLEHVLDLLPGHGGVLAVKSNRADVEGGHRCGELFGRALGSSSAVVAGHQGGTENETSYGK